MTGRLFAIVLSGALAAAAPAFAQGTEQESEFDERATEFGDDTPKTWGEFFGRIGLGGTSNSGDEDGSGKGEKGFFGTIFGGDGGPLSKFEGRFIKTLKPGRIARETTDGSVPVPSGQGLLLARREALGAGMVPLPIPVLEKYAEGILRKLLAHSPISGIEPKVVIVARDRIHGEAFPDGTVFLTLGAIRNFESEDELAALLAHEISHVILRHHGSDWFMRTQERGLSALDLVLEIKSKLQRRSRSGIDWERQKMLLIGEAVVFASDILIDSPFTRGQEDEADLLGTDLLVAAKYNPDGMADMLNKLVTQEAESREIAKKQTAERDAASEREMLEEIDRKGVDGIFSQLFKLGGQAIKTLGDELKSAYGVKHHDAEARRQTFARYMARNYGALPPAQFSRAPWSNITNQIAVKDALAGYRDVLKAREAYSTRDFATAVKRIRQALDVLSPEHPLPRVVAAEISAAVGNVREAEIYFAQGLAAIQPPLSAYTGLAELQRNQRRIGESRKTLRLAARELDDPPQLLPDRITMARAASRKQNVMGLMAECKLAALEGLFKSCERANEGKFARLELLTPNERRAAAKAGSIGVERKFVRVNVPSANARNGPGTGHEIVQAFKQGTALMVLGDTGKWSRVRADDGRVGWVANWLTSPAPDIKPRLFPAIERLSGVPPKPRPLAAPAPGRAAGDIRGRLRRLKSLRQQDLITDEEYKAKRREILKAL